MGSSEPPGPGWGRSGPSGALWPSGTQGRVGGGCGSAGHLALPPEPAAVEGVLNDSSVYRWPWSQREAALPPGSWPQRTQQSAFVGGLTRPRKERCTHWVLASLLTAFPPRGGRAPSPTVSLGKQPGPAPPQQGLLVSHDDSRGKLEGPAPRSMSCLHPGLRPHAGCTQLSGRLEASGLVVLIVTGTVTGGQECGGPGARPSPLTVGSH